LSALETLRRNCRGCLDVGFAALEKGPFGGLLDVVRRWFGDFGGKVEL
jgi:hypothetical protein